MCRLIGMVVVLHLTVCSFSQSIPAPVQASDPRAVSLAQKSIAVLTGGILITDVTLHASVTSIVGSDNETGTATFRAKGINQSRIDIRLSTNGSRSEVRNASSGFPGGAWSKNAKPSTAMAQHNAWTDASWFFPPLSCLSQTTNTKFVFIYIGPEQHTGLTVEHIQIHQLPPTGLTNSPIYSLSTMDFYLDPTSSLPLAVNFSAHSDTNIGVSVPIEVKFANYQAVDGIQVPFHFQKLLNGMVTLDVNVTSAVFKTGLQDSVFILQ
jgi:hypothetical protein